MKNNNLPPLRGNIKEVSSLSNPLIKSLKSLHLKKYRQQDGCFLVEGIKLIKDGLAFSWPIASLVISLEKKQDPLYQDLIMKALNQGAQILFVPKKILANLSKRDNPQNAIASFYQRSYNLAQLAPRKEQIYLALDRIRDPGNLGTIIRTADAAGIQGVILIGECTDLYALETIRATMGSIFAIKIYFSEEDSFLKFQKDNKIHTIGTHLQGGVDYRQIDYPFLLKNHPLCLLMGNEQKGLSTPLSKEADQLALIPQTGNADSLNLSIASALMIFEAKRHLL